MNDVAVELGPVSQPSPTRLVSSIALVARSNTRVYLDTSSLRNFSIDMREKGTTERDWRPSEMIEPKHRFKGPPASTDTFVSLKKGSSYRIQITGEVTPLVGEKIEYNWGESGFHRLSQDTTKRIFASFSPSHTYASDSIEYFSEGIAVP